VAEGRLARDAVATEGMLAEHAAWLEDIAEDAGRSEQARGRALDWLTSRRAADACRMQLWAVIRAWADATSLVREVTERAAWMEDRRARDSQLEMLLERLAWQEDCEMRNWCFASWVAAVLEERWQREPGTRILENRLERRDEEIAELQRKLAATAAPAGYQHEDSPPPGDNVCWSPDSHASSPGKASFGMEMITEGADLFAEDGSRRAACNNSCNNSSSAVPQLALSRPASWEAPASVATVPTKLGSGKKNSLHMMAAPGAAGPTVFFMTPRAGGVCNFQGNIAASAVAVHPARVTNASHPDATTSEANFGAAPRRTPSYAAAANAIMVGAAPVSSFATESLARLPTLHERPRRQPAATVASTERTTHASQQAPSERFGPALLGARGQRQDMMALASLKSQGDMALESLQYWEATRDVTWLRTKGFDTIQSAAKAYAKQVTRGPGGIYSIDLGGGDWAAEAFGRSIARSILRAAHDLAEAAGVKTEDFSRLKEIADGLAPHRSSAVGCGR